MINVLLVARKSLLTQPGGDTYQILQTKERLIKKGIKVDLYLHETSDLDLASYDILHFFNIGRPADFLQLAMKSGKPYIITPIFVDYSEVELNWGGWRGRIAKVFGTSFIEYLKTILRALNGSDGLSSKRFVFLGWKQSIKFILRHAAAVLPHTKSEQERLEKRFGNWKGITKINFPGLDIEVPDGNEKESNLVVCVARIEKLKNQLGLIRALKNTNFKLVLIGEVAANQWAYFDECKKEGGNVIFAGQLSRSEVAIWMSKAKVHAMPSFFETTGLSTAESLLCGCNAVITNAGDQEECFGDSAFYCNPMDIESIKCAVEKAMRMPLGESTIQEIKQRFSWENNIDSLVEAYLGVV